MKLGQVIKQERQPKGLTSTDVASSLGLSLDDYKPREAGKSSGFETAAELILGFNELIEGQVNQLYYPCGLPFSAVANDSVS